VSLNKFSSASDLLSEILRGLEINGKIAVTPNFSLAANRFLLARLRYEGTSIKVDENEKTQVIDEYKEASHALQETPVFGENTTLRELLLLPTVMLERDAMYRMLLAVREIKKTIGVDFSRPYWQFGEPSLWKKLLGFFLEFSPNSDMREVGHALRNMKDLLQETEKTLELYGLDAACVRKIRKEIRDEMINQKKLLH
jgi:hypothetical protein